MNKVRGVLLDIDGTLVDSNDAHAHAWVKAFEESGIRVSFSQVRRLIGKGGDKIISELAGWDHESPQARRLSDRRREIFEAGLPSLRAFPKAQELLARMHQDGMRLVVASSAKADELEALLKVCGADHFVEGKTSSDDADRSKPDPDIVTVALRKISLPTSQVVMLGDTPYDVEAATRAGIRVIALRCGGWGDDDLAGAVAIYDDPADLLEHYDSSPLAT